MANNDPYDLDRFVSAQATMFESALAELGNGQKKSHWMWFIFPQIEGLGYSEISRYYSIKSMEEAQQYLRHPILGPRLLKCTETVLALNGKAASEIFGSPDDLKFKSSMTLFTCATEPDSLFAQTLEKYFDGERDKKTEFLLGLRAE